MSVEETTSPLWDKLTSFLEEGGSFTTGIHESEGGATSDGEVTVAEAARNAEFGLGQPQRSFLREWFDQNRSEVEAKLVQEFRKSFADGKGLDHAAERVALWIQGSIQKNITTAGFEPNAPMTIAKKGFDQPLVHTGLLKSSLLSYYRGKPVA